MKKAVDYYHEELKKSNIAKDYLKSRGLTKESIVKFKLGYAPPNPEIGGRFHDRIIFPIWDPHGVPVGWTARTLIGASAKYLNVKESGIFQKSRLLYLYHLTKKAIVKTRAAVLVEGQMDAIILYQHNILNVVASSSTAFKPAAACLLARYVSKVYVVYDPDDAGVRARTKVEKVLNDIDPELKVIIVKLPGGEDPASFVLKYGREKFLDLLRNSQ
ncbi:toprim domain-containing protein [Patescibacteria group bacterium]|nr:toprim domain-containing protein [Patescibacteria group bacterium]